MQEAIGKGKGAEGEGEKLVIQYILTQLGAIITYG
jgi:hypothetical protein